MCISTKRLSQLELALLRKPRKRSGEVFTAEEKSALAEEQQQPEEEQEGEESPTEGEEDVMEGEEKPMEGEEDVRTKCLAQAFPTNAGGGAGARALACADFELGCRASPYYL